MSLSRYSLLFIIATVLIAIPPLALFYTGHGYMLVNKFNVMFFFFSVVTFLICTSVIIVQQKKQELGAPVFLIGTTVKLLLCMSFALAYLRQNHVNNVYFLGDFFYLYLLNTLFEIYSLLTNLRNSNFK